MTAKELRFRYGETHFDGARGLRRGLPVFLGGFLIPLVTQGADGSYVLAGLVCGLAGPITYFVTARISGQIVIGRRCVVVGQDIFYYRNLSQVKLDSAKQTLSLFKGSYPVCVIQAASFPTNARKADKIAKNRRDKFAKVADKLLARIRQAVPDVPIIRQESTESA